MVPTLTALKLTKDEFNVPQRDCFVLVTFLTLSTIICWATKSIDVQRYVDFLKHEIKLSSPTEIF